MNLWLEQFQHATTYNDDTMQESGRVYNGFVLDAKGVAEEEARAAATAVSQNSAHKSMAAIRREIAALERQCRSQLSQQRFLRASAPEQPGNKYAFAPLSLSLSHGMTHA